MDFEKLTNKSKELIQDVVNNAAREKHQFISTEHLLDALLKLKDSQINELLLQSGCNLAQLTDSVSSAVKKTSPAS